MSLLKYRLSKLGFLSSILFATSSNASVMSAGDPYLGADAQIRSMNWASGLGDNVFKKTAPQVNVYAGLRFCDYVGVEAGYEATTPRIVKNTIPSTSLFLGTPFPEVFSGPVLTEGKFEMNGWHGAFTGFIPVTSCDTLFGSVGIARLHAKHFATLIAQSGSGSLDQSIWQSRFSDKKTVARITGGYERLFNDCVGIRLSLGWENTNRLKNLRSRSNKTDRVSLKNSWNYGLGAFTTF